ncbi:MAG: DMT family transporter [Fibrobacter sp.]|nr:DMT family transporter [Fibrobacter sp.]
MEGHKPERRYLCIKGVACGVLAAICYGTNPLGALHLYQAGHSVETVLIYRFALGVCLLAGLMLLNGWRSGISIRQNFAVTRRALCVLILLGFLFAGSAFGLFASFNYMDAGLASTLLFLYPLEVAIIMGVFFREKLNLRTAASIAISMVGLALLYRGGAGGGALSTMGLLLVFASSVSYAIYIVVVNRAGLQMGSLKLTFYAMLFCLMFILICAIACGCGLPPVMHSVGEWMWAFMLGLVPTVLSLVFMAKAVKIVGSTPTAIMGALEPLTAVTIGVLVFDEVLTFRLATGIVLILAAVTLIAIKRK